MFIDEAFIGRLTGSMMVKAHIAVKLDGRDAIIPVLFNPSEYTIEKSNKYHEVAIPGMPSPIMQYVSGGARSLAMDLLLDTYEEKMDVRVYTRLMDRLLSIDSELHAPPVCTFVWGPVRFTAILEKLTKKFTMFMQDGTPVRASLNVTFKEYKTLEEQLKENPRHSSDKTKVRTAVEGDSLWSIAAHEYGDPGEWRHIARANGIENPRKLVPGTCLTIPPLG